MLLNRSRISCCLFFASHPVGDERPARGQRILLRLRWYWYGNRLLALFGRGQQFGTHIGAAGALAWSSANKIYRILTEWSASMRRPVLGRCSRNADRRPTGVRRF